MRLIDADALLKSIESDRNCSDMPSQWLDGVNYAIDLIELYEPTIDIVRCGECKMWINEHLCQWWSRYGTVETDADDFCSFGEVSEKPTGSEKPNNSTISKMEQVEDDAYFLELMGAVERGEISDAGANQAWYEYINHKDEQQTERSE